MVNITPFEVIDMEYVLRSLLMNFSLTFLGLGLIVSGVSVWRRSGTLTAPFVNEALFFYFLLFSIGVCFFCNFFVHTFRGDMTARFIGWGQSPSQEEVGMASLGYAAVGFLVFRGSFGLRVAAVVGPGIFLFGTAAGHAYQMILAHNFAPGHAGVIFYKDIAIPVIGAVLLWLQNRFARESSRAQ
jgi:hypothetical protein